MKNGRWYIDDECERGILSYKYHGSDASIVSQISTPFWNWIAEQFPRWLAYEIFFSNFFRPNLITFISFLFATVAFFLFVYHHEDFDGPTDTLIYVISAIFIFIYQTLDAVDGKQARRTGSSSALGELFDHGLDSFVTLYLCMISSSILRLGTSWTAFLWHITIYFSVYLTLWEEKFTLLLRFGKFNSISEILTFFILIMFVTAFTGNEFLLYNVFELFGYGEKYIFKIGHIIIVVGITVIPLNLYDTSSAVFKKISKNKKYTKTNVIMGLVPLFFVTFSYIFLYFTDPSFYKQNVVLFCCCYGMTVSYCSSRMIIARICKILVKPLYLIFIPLVIVMVIFCFCDIQVKLYSFVAMFSINLLFIAHMAFFVCNEICDVLKIKLFTIKYPN